MLLLAVTNTVYADEGWDLSVPSPMVFGCGGGSYDHTLNKVDVNLWTGYFTGEGTYNSNSNYTWDITGNITESDITFALVYTGINLGYTLNGIGTISEDGSIIGTVDNNCQTFNMNVGTASFNRHAEITAPDTDEAVYGMVDFEALLVDNDYDHPSWAVRKGTCAAGTNTVWGNVDTHNDAYTWEKTDAYTYTFSSTADTSSWDDGMYCFIFNPREDTGETDIRLTREFSVDADLDDDGILNGVDCDPEDGNVAVLKDSKACILYTSGVEGKGILNASGLEKEFNPKSKAKENAGKKN